MKLKIVLMTIVSLFCLFIFKELSIFKSQTVNELYPEAQVQVQDNKDKPIIKERKKTKKERSKKRVVQQEYVASDDQLHAGNLSEFEIQQDITYYESLLESYQVIEGFNDFKGDDHKEHFQKWSPVLKRLTELRSELLARQIAKLNADTDNLLIQQTN